VSRHNETMDRPKASSQRTMAGRGYGQVAKEAVMLGVIAVLLLLWVVFAVLGLVIKGLFWLFVIGLVLFLVTGALGVLRRGRSSITR
jgi:uncharacterized membrane protein